MTPEPTLSTRVVVIGAGITGLACAHKLVSLGVGTLVLEAATHPGGKIATVHHNGYEFEPGPSTVSYTHLTLPTNREV